MFPVMLKDYKHYTMYVSSDVKGLLSITQYMFPEMLKDYKHYTMYVSRDVKGL